MAPSAVLMVRQHGVSDTGSGGTSHLGLRERKRNGVEIRQSLVPAPLSCGVHICPKILAMSSEILLCSCHTWGHLRPDEGVGFAFGVSSTAMSAALLEVRRPSFYENCTAG